MGNARILFSDLNKDGRVDGSEILQENHYYPFGLNMEGPWCPDATNTTKNHYQFNGIELFEDLDLNVNFAFYRSYDAAIGRWWQVDPMAEMLYDFSTYTGMMNNPLYFNDPHGDIAPLLIAGAALVNGTLNVVNQALKGNVANFWQGLEYFAVGAVAGVAYAVPGGGTALAGTIQTVGNKAVQIVNGQWSPSDIDSAWDVAGLAFDVGTDFLAAVEGANLGKNLATKLGDKFGWFTRWGGGGPIVRTGGAVGETAFSAGVTEPIEIVAKKGSTSLVSLTDETFSQAVFRESFGLTEKIGNYSIYGTKGLVGNTFNRNIFYINSPKNAKNLANFRSLMSSMEKEAIGLGENKISIYGSSVVNKGFLSPNLAKRFGYSFQQSNSSVFLQKIF
ncbi:MAG: RHS repeat-associated core domain-containing protein [Chitinophagales bacterium]